MVNRAAAAAGKRQGYELVRKALGRVLLGGSDAEEATWRSTALDCVSERWSECLPIARTEPTLVVVIDRGEAASGK